MRSNSSPAAKTYVVLRHRAGNPSGLDIQVYGVVLDDFSAVNLSMDSDYRSLNEDTQAVVVEAIVAGVSDLIITNGRISLTYYGSIGFFLPNISTKLGLVQTEAPAAKRGHNSRR